MISIALLDKGEQINHLKHVDLNDPEIKQSVENHISPNELSGSLDDGDDLFDPSDIPQANIIIFNLGTTLHLYYLDGKFMMRLANGTEMPYKNFERLWRQAEYIASMSS